MCECVQAGNVPLWYRCTDVRVPTVRSGGPYKTPPQLHDKTPRRRTQELNFGSKEIDMLANGGSWEGAVREGRRSTEGLVRESMGPKWSKVGQIGSNWAERAKVGLCTRNVPTDKIWAILAKVEQVQSTMGHGSTGQCTVGQSGCTARVSRGRTTAFRAAFSLP